MHLVNQVHAVMLAGGSAFGLDAASGVVNFLEKHGIGFNTGVARVPIVPAAILFDLAVGSSTCRPDAAMGFRACELASKDAPLQGNYGAGTGAAVGKIFGIKSATKSGIGTSLVEAGGGVVVGAIMAVNAFGDILNPENRQIIAGARSLTGDKARRFADTLQVMKTWSGRRILEFASGQNTIIGVVATNARLSKDEANKVAQMAHNGIAITVRPAHTMFDGDTIFALATNKKKADVNLIGACAAEAVAQAIINAVQHAQPAGGLPSASSYTFSQETV
jgi:L-aminopeptidase/D-esterase-like protein